MAIEVTDANFEELVLKSEIPVLSGAALAAWLLRLWKNYRMNMKVKCW